MAFFARTASVDRPPSRSRTRRPRRAVAALLSCGLLLGPTACGFDKQTNKPYTPGQGVNGEAGNGLKYRNLMILSRAAGSGFLSATMTSAGEDALTGVSGNAIKPDGSDGAPLTAKLSSPVQLGNGVLVVLTQRPPITVSSPDLQPGLTARLKLQFAKAGEVAQVVPVVDAATQTEYVTVSPSPAATPSS